VMRQHHSALIAENVYYSGHPAAAPEWRRRAAAEYVAQATIPEPIITERLAGLTYTAAGHEDLRLPRMLLGSVLDGRRPFSVWRAQTVEQSSRRGRRVRGVLVPALFTPRQHQPAARFACGAADVAQRSTDWRGWAPFAHRSESFWPRCPRPPRLRCGR
jgi:hypothetical protein